MGFYEIKNAKLHCDYIHPNTMAIIEETTTNAAEDVWGKLHFTLLDRM
jgi:hypothetical protein